LTDSATRAAPRGRPTDSSARDHTATRPLEGVTALDLTNVPAGPFACYQLACLGARVIKVESPEGDLARKLGADPGYAEAGMVISCLAVNAGKQSIASNPASPNISRGLAPKLRSTSGKPIVAPT